MKITLVTSKKVYEKLMQFTIYSYCRSEINLKIFSNQNLKINFPKPSNQKNNNAPAGIRTRVFASRGRNDWPDYTTGAVGILK